MNKKVAKRVLNCSVFSLLLFNQVLPVAGYAGEATDENQKNSFEENNSWQEESLPIAEEAEKGDFSEESGEKTDTTSSQEEHSLIQTNVDIASGTFGTCPWSIDQEGTLHIYGGTLGYDPTSYWSSYREKIKKIVFEEAVEAHWNSSYLFYRLNSVTEIQNIHHLNTSNVTDMSGMFGFMSSLETLDVSNFDTSNVTSMKEMFNSIVSLQALDVSHFKTSNVTDMANMFNDLRNIESLNVSNFDTSKVTNTRGMFANTNKLTSLNVSNFDTSQVTDMSYMFSTPNIPALNLSNFDTSKVKNMQGMFAMRGIESLDLSNFDTKNVENMSYMFQSTENLKALDLSSFDMTNTTNVNEMFFTGNNRPITLESLKLGVKTKLSEAMGLKEPPEWGIHTGRWIKKDTIDAYSSSELVTQYEGSTMAGEYVWEENYDLKVRDIQIFVGDDWQIGDHVIAVTNQFGLDIPIEKLEFETLGVDLANKNVDTSQPGIYYIRFYQGKKILSGAMLVIEEKQTAVRVTDSTLFVGDDWKALDNFESAVDEIGRPVSFEEIKVAGEVDTSKAGKYEITYSYGGVSSKATVTVKERQTAIKVKDSTLFVGAPWQSLDNFESAVDETGSRVSFEEIKVAGEVDTSKAGKYEITYSYGGVSSKAIVTVKERQTAIKVKDSTLFVGAPWQSSDNFESAVDEIGRPVSFEEIKVAGEVDTSKAGKYEITYSYGGVSSKAQVTVVNKEKLELTNQDKDKDKNNYQNKIVSSNQRSNQQRKLPLTGEKKSQYLLISGLTIVVLALIILRKVTL